jgi:TetR/AcrR family transcriptional repressor of nem operon
MKTTSKPKASRNAKERLLAASLYTIRERGYAGTSVDDLCTAAGVTKGAFFHHFKSKEHLAVAAAERFSLMAESLFAMEPYRNVSDPVDRLLAYIDLRKELLHGELPEYTCLLGTMLQETYETHPAIREACNKAVFDHITTLEADVREAIRRYGIKADWTAKSLAAYTQSVIQGAFILAKAQYSPAIAIESLDHLRRYLKMIFTQPKAKGVA